MTMENSSNQNQSSKWKLPLLIAGFVIVVTLVFYFVFEGTKNDITIMNAGEKMTTSTHAATVGEALDESGIKIGKHDQVSPSKNTAIEDGMKITYKKAVQVTINDNGKKVKAWSTRKTVKGLLKDENVIVRPQDALNVALDDKVKDNLVVDIYRAIPLTLENGAKKESVWTTKSTVGDLLTEKNIKVGKDDRVSPAKTAIITPKMDIKVTYMAKKTVEKTETIKFTTVYKDDNNLAQGTEKVVSAGKNGEKKVKYEIMIENGKETKKDRISESVVSEKQDKIVARGTKQVQTEQVSQKPVNSEPVTNTAESSEKASGGKTMVMNSTAYSGGGVTATGINLSANPSVKVIAVDPSVIPLGSRVWVEGYGEAIAGDTGGAIKGNIIDVYFSDASSCYSWGRRTVTVKILN